MLTENQQKINSQKTEIDNSLETTKTEIQQMLMKMQSDTNNLNKSMDAIDKRLKDFVEQSKVFDKADELKAELKTDISDLKAEISEIQTFGKTIESIQNDFTKIKKIEDEISQHLKNFNSERNRIDSIETNFNTLIGLSNSIDAKISDLEHTNADMQNLQLDVRHFKNTLESISNRYDILEKKNSVIDKTVADVDKVFDNLKEIERRLENCNRTTEDFPSRISNLKTDVDSIMENIPKLKDAISKLDSLDDIILDANSKVDEIKSSKVSFANTETRLIDLDNRVTEKLRTLGEITKNSLPNSANISNSSQPGTRRTVVQLSHSGWTPESIANRLGISVGEVELILETYKE